MSTPICAMQKIIFKLIKFNDFLKNVAPIQFRQYVSNIKYKNRFEMKFIYTIVFSSLLLFCSTLANAQDAVMIIRFNKDVVGYEQPLEKVVDAALDAKASVFFDIVAIVPKTDSARMNRTYKSQTATYSNDVIDVLRHSGIAPDKIRITFQDSTLVDDSEVHIFVR